MQEAQRILCLGYNLMILKCFFLCSVIEKGIHVNELSQKLKISHDKLM